MTAEPQSIKKRNKVKRIVFIVSFLIMPCMNFLLFYVYVNLDSIAYRVIYQICHSIR